MDDDLGDSEDEIDEVRKRERERVTVGETKRFSFGQRNLLHHSGYGVLEDGGCHSN